MQVEMQARENTYKSYLLDLWTATSERMIMFRSAYLQNRAENEVLIEFISMLTELWVQIRPKARGRVDEKKFKKYDEYFKDPKKILEGENVSDIFELYFDIRDLLEEISITKFEAIEG